MRRFFLSTVARPNWNWKCWFLWRKGKKNPPTTSPTHMWHQVRELNPDHSGRMRVLSTLRHLCSPYYANTGAPCGPPPPSQTSIVDIFRGAPPSHIISSVRLTVLWGNQFSVCLFAVSFFLFSTTMLYCNEIYPIAIFASPREPFMPQSLQMAQHPRLLMRTHKAPVTSV